MLHCSIVLHGDPGILKRRYIPTELEGPNTLQLATSRPQDVGKALDALFEAGLIEPTFSEINLNCGCPAESALSGSHGAFLLQKHERQNLLQLCEELRKHSRGKRVSVKIRTGIEGEAEYTELVNMVREIASTGVDHIVLHARNAILGATCKENRRVPQLKMDWAQRLNSDIAGLVPLTFNGEVKSCYVAKELMDGSTSNFAGVMMGRLAMTEPFAFVVADEVVFGAKRVGGEKKTRHFVAERYAKELASNANASLAVSPLLNLFHGERRSKSWKHALQETKPRKNDSSIQEAFFARDAILRALESIKSID